MDDFKVVNMTKKPTSAPARKKMKKWFWFKFACFAVNSFFFGFFSVRLMDFANDNQVVTANDIFKTFGWLIGIITICFIYWIASLVREFYSQKK